MITWMLAFIFFIILLIIGETTGNIYLTKLIQSSHDLEDAAVKEN